MTRPVFFSPFALKHIGCITGASAVIGLLVPDRLILLRLLLILTCATLVSLPFMRRAKKIGKARKEQEQTTNSREGRTRIMQAPWWMEGLAFGTIMHISGSIVIPIALSSTPSFVLFLETLPTTLVVGLIAGAGLKLLDRWK